MRHLRRGPVALVFICFIVIVSSCAGVDAPRRSTRTTSANTVAFESPRTNYVVEESPDVGTVSFGGVVRGRSARSHFAAADGHVFDVRFARGDVVQQGDVVLMFLPLRSEAETIDLEIAQLSIERAEAVDDATAVADAQRVYDNLVVSYDDRAVDVRADTTGVIGSTRQNIRYPVREGDNLFTLSDPTDLVVEVAMTSSDWRSLPAAAQVAMVRSSGNTEETFAGRLQPVDPSQTDQAQAAQAQGDRAQTGGREDAYVAAVVLVDPTADLALGDRLAVSIAVEVGRDSRWVPEEMVHRRNGQSFLLAADAQGALSRLDAELGQRTLTHVQVLSPLAIGTTLVAPQ